MVQNKRKSLDNNIIRVSALLVEAGNGRDYRIMAFHFGELEELLLKRLTLLSGKAVV